MKRLLASAAALAIVVAGPAWAALAVGGKAADITAKAFENGTASPFQLSQALKKGPVVLYFFPGAFTAGCNVEAKAFADNIDKFKAAGATVVGVTSYFGTTARTSAAQGGLEQAIADFSKEHCNGKFPVAAVTPETVTAYDVLLQARDGATIANRTSFVIGQDGKIAFTLTDMQPTGHITQTLAAVEALKKR